MLIFAILFQKQPNIGEVVEWSITAVLKTVELKGSGGSNPSLSAKHEKTNQRRACSSADLFFSALQRPAAGGEGCRSASGATKSRRGRNSCKAVSFKLFARAPGGPLKTTVVILSPIRTEKRPTSVPNPNFRQSVRKYGLFQYRFRISPELIL